MRLDEIAESAKEIRKTAGDPEYSLADADSQTRNRRKVK